MAPLRRAQFLITTVLAVVSAPVQTQRSELDPEDVNDFLQIGAPKLDSMALNESWGIPESLALATKVASDANLNEGIRQGLIQYGGADVRENTTNELIPGCSLPGFPLTEGNVNSAINKCIEAAENRLLSHMQHVFPFNLVDRALSDKFMPKLIKSISDGDVGVGTFSQILAELLNSRTLPTFGDMNSILEEFKDLLTTKPCKPKDIKCLLERADLIFNKLPQNVIKDFMKLLRKDTFDPMLAAYKCVEDDSCDDGDTVQEQAAVLFVRTIQEEIEYWQEFTIKSSKYWTKVVMDHLDSLKSIDILLLFQEYYGIGMSLLGKDGVEKKKESSTMLMEIETSDVGVYCDGPRADNSGYDCLSPSGSGFSGKTDTWSDTWYGSYEQAKEKCDGNTECKYLYDYWGDGKNWRACRAITAPGDKGAVVQEKCKESSCDETLLGKGEDYHGCQSKTQTGRTCQKWSSQHPHTHDLTPEEKPKAGLWGHNYCRNPDGEKTIWCYTTDPGKRWESCNPLESAGGSYSDAPRGNNVGYECACAWGNGEYYCNDEGNKKTWYGSFEAARRKCDASDKCQFLHDYWGDGKNWRACSKITSAGDRRAIIQKKGQEDCDEDILFKGKDYRGCQSKTRTGRTCQKWSWQRPHTHDITPEKYPASGLWGHNYCRNPDAEEKTIWCYTTDPSKRWDFCDPIKEEVDTKLDAMDAIKLLYGIKYHHFDADVNKAFVHGETCHKESKAMMKAFREGTGDWCEYSRTKYCANTKNNLGRAAARKLQNMMKCGLDNAIDASVSWVMKKIAIGWGLKEDFAEKSLEGVAGVIPEVGAGIFALIYAPIDIAQRGLKPYLLWVCKYFIQEFFKVLLRVLKEWLMESLEQIDNWEWLGDTAVPYPDCKSPEDCKCHSDETNEKNWCTGLNGFFESSWKLLTNLLATTMINPNLIREQLQECDETTLNPMYEALSKSQDSSCSVSQPECSSWKSKGA